MMGRIRRRLRSVWGDDSGISIESILIGIALVIILGTAAVFAIQWARNLGQTTVARTNLDVAVQAATLQHAASARGEYSLAGIANAAPELSFIPITTSGNLTRATQPGTPAIAGSCSDSSGNSDRATCEAISGASWTAAQPGALASGQVGYTIGDATSVNIPATETPRALAEDIMWLFTLAENGDTYCAVILAEVQGAQADVGAWYDAKPAAGTLAGRATCNAFPTSPHGETSDISDDLGRSIPSIN